MDINAADTVWVMVSTAMVMLMTPGVALFYGGMVQRKNVLSTLMMSFVALGIVGVLWVIYGYTLGFGGDVGSLIGNLEYLFLNNVGMDPANGSTIPHLTFMMFQGMFAIIAVALIAGAVIGRIKFSALIVFSIIWLTVIYSPVAHWVWGENGWLANLGALDFAGGTVVHISSGASALALALLLGPRKGFKEGVAMEPHNIPMTALGAALLWFGWFGFNAGSSLAADGLAANAFVATNIAAASAAVTWMVLSWASHRPTLLGLTTGAVAGLVAITPAAGFVEPIMAIPIGIGASLVCYLAMKLRLRKKVDESLDVFAIHGIGGAWGALTTGVFASAAIGGTDGLINGNPEQVWIQFIGIAAVFAFAFFGTLGVGKLVDKTVGLRVKGEEETVGLDISQHGERAYGGLLR